MIVADAGYYIEWHDDQLVNREGGSCVATGHLGTSEDIRLIEESFLNPQLPQHGSDEWRRAYLLNVNECTIEAVLSCNSSGGIRTVSYLGWTREYGQPSSSISISPNASVANIAMCRYGEEVSSINEIYSWVIQQLHRTSVITAIVLNRDKRIHVNSAWERIGARNIPTLVAVGDRWIME